MTFFKTKDNQKPPPLEIIILLLILALAAYLRLANLADNPSWYTDEGTHLNIAQNLLQGRIQYMAINQSTLLFAKLPLFEILLAGVLNLKGEGISTLRTFTGMLGVISVGMLYGVVRQTQARKDGFLPLLSAFIFAIYPPAVLYSRFGFSYNLLTPLVLLLYLGLWKYMNPSSKDTVCSSGRRWLILAVLAVGVGGVSDLWMFSLVVPLVLLVAFHNWRDLGWSLPLLALPFGLYAAVMLLDVPQAFLFDLRFTLFRLGKLSPLTQLRTLIHNLTTLISQDYWLALAMIGLLMLRPVRRQRLVLFIFLFPILILGRTVALFSLSFYYMIPLLPFIGLGMAVIIRQGVPYISQLVQRGLFYLLKRQFDFVRTGLSLSLSLIVAMAFLTSLGFTANDVHQGFQTPIDVFLIDPHHARHVAEFVNSQTNPDDVVIVSPGLAWLFQANVADFQMSAVVTGQETVHLPANLPPNRFAFNPHYSQARFVIVDNLWRNWAVWHVAGVHDILYQMQHWPLVFKVGEIEVYCNPTQQK